MSREQSDDMYTEANRLKSFQNWPFREDAKCNAVKMAEAGFFHCPTHIEPDLVQCYVCFKELDGWQLEDEPWEEHFSHSKVCLFAQLRKPQKDLSVEEIHKIEAARKINKIKKLTAKRLQKFEQDYEDMNDLFSSAVNEIEAQMKKK